MPLKESEMVAARLLNSTVPDLGASKDSAKFISFTPTAYTKRLGAGVLVPSKTDSSSVEY